MPKLSLPQEMQDEMDIEGRIEENSAYLQIPNGIYVIKVYEVETVDDKGNPLRTANQDLKWTWTFRVVRADDGTATGRGRRFKETTAFIPKAKFKLEDIYAAFGMTKDSTIDEFMKEEARVYVDERVQSGGEYDGQKQNYIKTWYPQL